MDFRKIAAIGILGGLFYVPQVMAHLPKVNIPEKRQKLESRGGGLLSTVTHERLERVHSYMASENYKDALELLKKLEISVKNRPIELAQVAQTTGFVYLQSGQYKPALSYLQKSLDLEILPIAPTLSTLFTIAQVQVSLNQLDEGLKTILEWFASVDKGTPQAYALLATIYAGKENKSAALANMEKAIGLSNAPKKEWLQFAAALHIEEKNYQPAERYLKILTANYPNEKTYWKQLTGVYIHLQDNKNALATMELAHKWGHLDSQTEYLNLTSLYLGRGLPYWAAKTLEQGISLKKVAKEKKTLTLLAQSYLQAEELSRAITPLAEAAKLSEDGDLYVLKGQLHLETEEWSAAIEAFKMSLKKGKLKHPGRSQLGLGIALLQSGQKSAARSAFMLAAKHDDTEKSAEEWLKHR